MSDWNHEIEWVVAVLAPWAVSPHPNFTEKEISQVSELALVTERRDRRELDRYGIESVISGEEWRGTLVNSARDSLFAETQESSTEILWGTVASSELPLGARIAAALYGSVGLSELEQPQIAAERLRLLFESLTGASEPADFSPSSRLGIGAVLQQRVARLEDACEYEAARTTVEQVLRWLPSEGAAFDSDFPVSQGISWAAQQVQADVVVSLRDHALASKAHLEQLSGDTWVQVVKSRGGWLDSRVSSRAAERDAMVLRDSFEKFFDSTSGTRYLMREASAEKGYSALLVAELSGHTSRIRSCREALGKVILLEDQSSVEQVREAIRLLRQSRATKSLQSALQWIRNQGPTAALKIDAELVIDRINKARWVTEADLSVIEAASDFLEPELLASSVHAAFIFLETEQVSARADWAVLDKMWKTVARLVSGSGEDNFVATRAADYLNKPDLLSEPFSSTLAKAIEAVDWSLVSQETLDVWKRWIAAANKIERDAKQLQTVAARCIEGIRHGMESMQGLERAAFLADNGLPAGQDESVLVEARNVVVDLLEADARAARAGAMSFGGLSPANVAAAFAIRFSDKETWMALADFLTDAKIDAVLKDQALDRMANRSEDVPAPVRKALNLNWKSVIDGPRDDHHFGAKPLPVFASAVRLGGALGLMSHTDALNAVLKLASSDAQARLEAARTIPYVLPSGDATWGHVLLLQLSRDINPEVRAEAGHSLVLSMRQPSPITSAVEARLGELMSSDGIRVPLKVLHAVQRLAGAQRELVEFMRSPIQRLTQEDRPRVVRGAAHEALFRMNAASSLM